METTPLDLDLIIADDGSTEKLAQELRKATDQHRLRKFIDEAVVVLKPRLS